MERWAYVSVYSKLQSYMNLLIIENFLLIKSCYEQYTNVKKCELLESFLKSRKHKLGMGITAP